MIKKFLETPWTWGTYIKICGMSLLVTALIYLGICGPYLVEDAIDNYKMNKEAKEEE